MDMDIFFFENGVAFNIANNPSYINMCRSIGSYECGLKPPTAYELLTSILKAEESNTQPSIAKASNFLYNHGCVLALIKTHTKKELIWPASTRFAITYLTLENSYKEKKQISHRKFEFIGLHNVQQLKYKFLKKHAINDDEDPLVSDDVPSDDERLVGEDYVGKTSTDVDMSQPNGSS
ncbi:hypothetical protein Dsin_024854 [Dipteronia sinensis]|uniref:Uncharacterized protein n=1 Tax=Dipteronia sinensis TaxID=43782 RepID=A0AAD9ZVV4_9ROSI|nr:hypothetical protein Dsin_024854 [Dipteronia sinensis]